MNRLSGGSSAGSGANSTIERWKDEPFFLYFAHYNVHTPIQGRQDLVESVDQSVGRVRNTLARLGLLQNTVIVYTSDNGGLTSGNNGPTNNAPLRAGKGSPYEGGVRVPAIVSWPGSITAGTICNEPIITCDLYPTILELTGTRGNPGHNANVDGVSLVPLLKQTSASLGREAIYWHYPHYRPNSEASRR